MKYDGDKASAPYNEITVTITHPEGNEGELKGFSSVWSKHVWGFNNEKHCQNCLEGAMEWASVFGN